MCSATGTKFTSRWHYGVKNYALKKILGNTIPEHFHTSHIHCMILGFATTSLATLFQCLTALLVKTFFSNIQSKPPLVQLEAVPFPPLTCYMGKEINTHLATTSLLTISLLSNWRYQSYELCFKSPVYSLGRLWGCHPRVPFPLVVILFLYFARPLK